MTSFRRNLRLGLGMAILASGGSSSVADAAPHSRVHKPKPTARHRHVAAPAILQQQIVALGRAFDGKAGVAIVSLKDGWEADWNSKSFFPQQSCSKLWVAITALDEVDHGKIALANRVSLRRNDLTLFHQPIAAKIIDGSLTSITLGELLFNAITQSDNTANDKLLRSIGGPPAVRRMIARKGLGAIRFYNGERALQSKIAGLTWNPAYSIGTAFFDARSALPMPARQAAFERYLRSPYDGASPHAIAAGLAALRKGQLLSPESTNLLLTTMGQTKTGGLRVRAALSPGWTWNHKTGTGQELSGRIGGINDIGLLTAPDGTIYAVAIMTVPRNNSDGDAQKLMRDVATAIQAYHQSATVR